MAISQDAIHKSGIGEVNPASASGECYVVIGGIWFITGSGAPVTGASSEMKDAPKGSLYCDVNAPKLYLKSSAGDGTTNTTWIDLTATS